jgi:uncharacterized protein
MRYGPASRS